MPGRSFSTLRWMNKPGLLCCLAASSAAAAAQTPAPTPQQATTPQAAIDQMQAGNFQAAERSWQSLIAQHPHDARLYAELGSTLGALGDDEGAAHAFRQSLQIDPSQLQVQMALGLIEFKQGHFAAAVAPFRAVEAAGQDPRAPLLLGMSYFGLHQYARAVAPLEKAVAAAPDNLELRRTIANSCLWSGNAACAMTQVQAILDKNPDSAQARMLMAEALDASDRTPEAIAELQKAEQLSPREPMLHFELGYLYFKRRDLSRATAEFHAELAENPGSALAYTYLGEIGLQQNDLSAAATQLQKAVELEPGLSSAHFDLGSVYAQQNELQRAIAQFTQAEALDPDDAATHYRLGRLYRQTGQTAQAEKELAITATMHQKKQETLVEQMSKEQERLGDGH